MLSDDMKRVIAEQRLGFVATVGPDGSPNLSPKGTIGVWDDGHIFFADIRSPQTIANIRRGSAVEVNIVDQLARKGYRFKGPAVVYERGTPEFERGVELLASDLAERFKAIVVIEVREARPLISPVYDDGVTTEEEVVARYRRRFLGEET